MDPQKVVADFLIDTRSLNPLYEDTVTMGVNAAAPMLEGEDTQAIGMLVVGTESSVDFGKPISTNIHGALGLPSNVRNFETKHACYSGVAALDTALNWIASGLNRGRKALVISTDFSRMHLSAKEEFVLGGVAAAVLVSDSPRVVEYELTKRGTWTSDVYDTFRPSARHEMGNNEVSLYTYLDALEGSYRDYVEAAGEAVDFDGYFAQNCYHTPFPGMAFQAHRTTVQPGPSAHEAGDPGELHAEDTALPPVCPTSRLHVRGQQLPRHLRDRHERAGREGRGPHQLLLLRIRAQSGSSTAVVSVPRRGRSLPACGIDEALDARREVSVAEYETIEKMREQAIEQPCFTPDLSLPAGWYDAYYQGKKRLVLRAGQGLLPHVRVELSAWR